MSTAGKDLTVLHGITWDHPRGYSPLYASAGRYEKLGNVRLLWDRRSLKDFGDMPVRLLAEKYDLLIIDHPQIAAAVNEGCLLRLDELAADEALAAFARQTVGPGYLSYRYAGHQWALPVDAACQVAAYRPDLLKDEIPGTWEEVFSLAARLGLRKKFIGLALCPTDAACTFLTLAAQCQDAPEEHKKELVGPGTGVEVLECMLQLKRVSHPRCLDWNPIGLYDYMVENEDLCYSPLGFGYVNYATGKDRPQLKFTGIPGREGALLGGAGIALSSKCRHVDAALKYIRWICDPGYQRTDYLREGGQPAQLDAWTDEAADAYAGGFFSGTLATIKQAYVRPRMARWPLYQEYLGEEIHHFLVHEKDATATVAELNRAYKKMFYT